MTSANRRYTVAEVLHCLDDNFDIPDGMYFSLRSLAVYAR